MTAILQQMHLLHHLKLLLRLRFAGTLTFNPLTDSLENDKGEKVKLDEPKAQSFPQEDF